MHQEGHVGLNLLLFAPVAYWLVDHGEYLLMGLAMIGVVSMAPFPDIDMSLPIKHRGPTHSIWFAFLVGVVYAAILVYAGFGELTLVETASVGFLSGFVGVIGHILGDVITPMGVAPLEPLSPFYLCLELTTAGDPGVNRGFLKAGSYAFVIAIVLGTVDVYTFVDPFLRVLS